MGANAFAHEAGIHQHGVLLTAKHRNNDSQSIGLPKQYGFGKHSGKHAIETVEELGHEITKEEMESFREIRLWRIRRKP